MVSMESSSISVKIFGGKSVRRLVRKSWRMAGRKSERKSDRKSDRKCDKVAGSWCSWELTMDDTNSAGQYSAVLCSEIYVAVLYYAWQCSEIYDAVQYCTGLFNVVQ